MIYDFQFGGCLTEEQADAMRGPPLPFEPMAAPESFWQKVEGEMGWERLREE